jgi:hypothetical protein
MGNLDPTDRPADQAPTDEEVSHAISILKSAGTTIHFEHQAELQYLTVHEVAACLSVDPKWVRAHLDEFPNAFTLDSRSIRIPKSDLEDAIERWRIKK